MLRSQLWIACAVAASMSASPVGAASPEARHFAVNIRGDLAAALNVGFNLADVDDVAALRALPEGMKGVFWLGNGYNRECRWRLSDKEVRDIVEQIKEHPKFSGIYYISDEPHPKICPDAPARLAERTALIKLADPGAKTFIVVLNGTDDPTEFVSLRDSADYIGVDPYPCNRRNAETGCDMAALRNRVIQALGSGISADRIVPVFQAFGQSCAAVPDRYYRLPTVRETQGMFAVWDSMIPIDQRPFDMTYSWNRQRVACPALNDSELVEHYRNYFLERKNLRSSTRRYGQ